MWSATRHAARFATLATIAGAGLAAATPAQACMDWGYSGVYSHGWPYANTGFASYPAYAWRSCGGHYEIQGWGECNGFGTCAFAPLPPLAVNLPVTEPAAAVQPGDVAVTRRPARRKAHGAVRSE